MRSLMQTMAGAWQVKQSEGSSVWAPALVPAPMPIAPRDLHSLPLAFAPQYC